MLRWGSLYSIEYSNLVQKENFKPQPVRISRTALREQAQHSKRVRTHAAKKRRLTVRSGKGGGNFSKEAIIDSCGPRDGGGCKKRIETSATFHGYERHAGIPIGTACLLSLALYLALPA